MRTIPGALKIFPVLLISFIILTINGCQKTAIQYGQQYIDNGITNIILVDSIRPVVSTILKDSVITSQSGTLQIGSYLDPYFGKTSSSAYLELAPPAALTDLLNNAQFDSLVLLMKSNGNYYGDTTLPITLSVNQLTQEIKFFDGQYNFANYTTFPLNPTPLGTRSFVLRPLTNDSANIRLADATGLQLFNMIRLKADILKENTTFTDFFKGLNISSTTNNNIFGMKDSVIMRLYYHQTDVTQQFKYFDFTFYNKPLQFNNIVADRTGTPLTALTTQNMTTSELFSTSSNNVGYLQSSTGLYLKISFPTIRKLLERTDFIKIIRADLIVKPLLNSYYGIYPLPYVLNAAQTDGANEPGALITSANNGAASTETGNLFIDGVYGINTAYTFDVTSYLTQELAIATINKDGLLLLPPAGTRFSNMNRLVIGDAFNEKNKLQLNIYYISVNK